MKVVWAQRYLWLSKYQAKSAGSKNSGQSIAVELWSETEMLIQGINTSGKAWHITDKSSNDSKTLQDNMRHAKQQTHGHTIRALTTAIHLTMVTKWLPSLVEIGPVILEKKMKMWKVFNDDANRQILSRKSHLSFQLRWAKN